MSIGNFPEIVCQRISVGIDLSREIGRTANLSAKISPPGIPAAAVLGGGDESPIFHRPRGSDPQQALKSCFKSLQKGFFPESSFSDPPLESLSPKRGIEKRASDPKTTRKSYV